MIIRRVGLLLLWRSHVGGVDMQCIGEHKTIRLVAAREPEEAKAPCENCALKLRMELIRLQLSKALNLATPPDLSDDWTSHT